MTRVLRLRPGQAAVEASAVDPAKVIEGAPAQEVENHFSMPDGRFHAGYWSSTAGKWRVAYAESEFCQLLEGEVELVDAAGHAERFVAGEAFVIPAGFEGSWESLGRVRKLYVIYE